MKDWRETSWTFEDGAQITISEVLKRSKDIQAVDMCIGEVEEIRTVAGLDQERVEQADIRYPILIVENKDEKYILDGNHRLQKAIITGKRTIKVKFLRGII